MIDLTKEKYKRIAPSLTREEFETAIDNGEEIYGFIGWVETTKAKSNGLVPETFPNYNKPLMEDYDVEETYLDEEGEEQTRTVTLQRPVMDGEEPVMVAKTFKEYVGGNYREGVAPTSTKCMLPIGYRDEHGNLTHIVTDEELRLWVDYFTLAKVKTKSEGITLLNSTVYKPKETEV